MLFIFFIRFAVINFVWPYAEQTVFSALVGVFRHFSLHFRFSCLLLHDFQTSDDLYPAEQDVSLQPLRFEFLSPFSLRCLWLSPFQDILWRGCLYSIVATWGFKSSMAFSASKSCGGSMNWGSHSQFLWTAAQGDLDFDFVCFIGFFSTKLSTLNMVPTQRNYGNS